VRWKAGCWVDVSLPAQLLLLVWLKNFPKEQANAAISLVLFPLPLRVADISCAQTAPGESDRLGCCFWSASFAVFDQ
jgi:hypothetical protein